MRTCSSLLSTLADAPDATLDAQPPFQRFDFPGSPTPEGWGYIRARIDDWMPQGLSWRDFASLFRVDASTLFRHMQQHLGDTTLALQSRASPPVSEAKKKRLELLNKLCQEGTDHTVRSLAAAMKENGISVSPTTVWYDLDEAGIPLRPRKIQPWSGSAGRTAMGRSSVGFCAFVEG